MASIDKTTTILVSVETLLESVAQVYADKKVDWKDLPLLTADLAALKDAFEAISGAKDEIAGMGVDEAKALLLKAFDLFAKLYAAYKAMVA